MKEKWENFRATLSDVTMMSKREFLLTAAVCILGGMVFGMLFSPRKYSVIGSHNGNTGTDGSNVGNCPGIAGEDEEEIEF